MILTNDFVMMQYYQGGTPTLMMAVRTERTVYPEPLQIDLFKKATSQYHGSNGIHLRAQFLLPPVKLRYTTMKQTV